MQLAEFPLKAMKAYQIFICGGSVSFLFFLATFLGLLFVGFKVTVVFVFEVF